MTEDGGLKPRRLVVGVTGATGSIYAIRLLQALERTDVESHLVLSRWGETIWEYHDFLPNDPAFGWDGFHRGRLLDVGVYTWFAEVEFVDGEVIVFEGDVTLVR